MGRSCLHAREREWVRQREGYTSPGVGGEPIAHSWLCYAGVRILKGGGGVTNVCGSQEGSAGALVSSPLLHLVQRRKRRRLWAVTTKRSLLTPAVAEARPATLKRSAASQTNHSDWRRRGRAEASLTPLPPAATAAAAAPSPSRLRRGKKFWRLSMWRRMPGVPRKAAAALKAL